MKSSYFCKRNHQLMLEQAAQIGDAIVFFLIFYRYDYS